LLTVVYNQWSCVDLETWLLVTQGCRHSRCNPYKYRPV